MGKAEQFKLERRLQTAQQQLENKQKQERNKVFIGGFIAGFLVCALFSSVFILGRGNGSNNTTVVPNVSSGSANLASPLALPSQLQIPAGQPLGSPANNGGLQLSR